jgi:hypothetical protein
VVNEGKKSKHYQDMLTADIDVLSYDLFDPKVCLKDIQKHNDVEKIIVTNEEQQISKNEHKKNEDHEDALNRPDEIDIGFKAMLLDYNST